jgi:hypothetical protein
MGVLTSEGKRCEMKIYLAVLFVCYQGTCQFMQSEDVFDNYGDCIGNATGYAQHIVRQYPGTQLQFECMEVEFKGT